jgi:hypothetical protein
MAEELGAGRKRRPIDYAVLSSGGYGGLGFDAHDLGDDDGKRLKPAAEVECCAAAHAPRPLPAPQEWNVRVPADIELNEASAVAVRILSAIASPLANALLAVDPPEGSHDDNGEPVSAHDSGKGGWSPDSCERSDPLACAIRRPLDTYVLYLSACARARARAHARVRARAPFPSASPAALVRPPPPPLSAPPAARSAQHPGARDAGPLRARHALCARAARPPRCDLRGVWRAGERLGLPRGVQA